MAATYNEIKSWFERGTQDENNTHMIVVCDTFDWYDYPIFVTKDQNIYEVESEYKSKSMQNVMEVYNLKDDINKQLSMTQCFCY